MKRRAFGHASAERKSQARIDAFAVRVAAPSASAAAAAVAAPAIPSVTAAFAKRQKQLTKSGAAMKPATLLQCGVTVAPRTGPMCLCGVPGRAAIVEPERDAKGKVRRGNAKMYRVCGLLNSLQAAMAPRDALPCPMHELIEDRMLVDTAERPRCGGCNLLCTYVASRGGTLGERNPNYGRRYYRCARLADAHHRPPPAGCSAFCGWADAPPDGTPECECGVPCAVRQCKKEESEHCGRFFYCCEQDDIDTRCRYFEWHPDFPPQSDPGDFGLDALSLYDDSDVYN
jgi:hypothetical protein